MPKRKECVIVFFCLIWALTSAQADIYRSENADGRISFSDRPTAGAEKLPGLRPQRYRTAVKRVIDGDTIELADGHRVRLIGINTPEINSHYREAEPGGEAAKAWLEDRLGTGNVYLELDAEQNDKYGRQLAHCFLENGDYINAALLEEGLAMLTLTPPNLRYAQQLQRAQSKAETSRRGIWAMPAYQVKKLSELDSGKQYRGWQRWRVKPIAVAESRNYMKLVVADNLLLLIPKQQLPLFPPLETYLNTTVEVRGWLSRSKQQYSMLIRHPSAIIHP